MKKTYEKPLQRNLKDYTIANGSCNSGNIPLEQCQPSGNTNAGLCNAGGSHVGVSCGPTGNAAQDCITGNFAGL